MRKLDIGKKYRIDLAGTVSLGSIPEMRLYDRLRDGRIIGLLVEDIIACEFSGLTRTQHNGASHDLIKTDCRVPVRLQCKSFKDNHADLSPSYMKGKGRKFCTDAFIEYFDSIDAWIFADISTFPVITVYVIGKEAIQDEIILSASSARIHLATLRRLTN
jgi:hypothetical protein